MHAIRLLRGPGCWPPALALAVTIACCTSDSTAPFPVYPRNQLAVTAVPDLFRLWVDADRFTAEGGRPVYFTARLHTVRCSIAAYAGGSVRVLVRDLAGTTVRVDSLHSDTSLAVTQALLTTPWTFDYAFAGFSGRLEYSVEREEGENAAPLRAYPLERGTWWQYTVLRSNLAAESVTVSIDRDTVIAGMDRASVWGFQGRTWRYQALSTVRADTVTLAFIGEGLWPPVRLQFPLLPGLLWWGSFNDRWFVESTTGNYQVPAGRCALTYDVEQRWEFLNDRGQLRRWMVAGIGLVAFSLQRVGMFPAGERWELIAAFIPRRSP